MRRLVERRVDLGDHAPITEALIDIQAQTPDDLDLDELRSFSARWPERFAESRLQTQFESRFRVEPGQSTPSLDTQHAVRGFLFPSHDQQRVVQVRRDGFTFSRLRPYQSWSALREEAAELWQHYKAIARPATVTRLAVRYVNRIWLPSEQEPIELCDWLTLHPEVPDHLAPIEEFLMRTVARHPVHREIRALVTTATQPRDKQQRPSVVLDIDVFMPAKLTVDDDDVIWSSLDDLRVFKNDVFFGIITKRTEESFYK